MKYCKLFLFLLLTIMDVSTNAQEVTCEGEQLLNVDILMGHPGIVSPYKPGHILVFRCTDVNLKMFGQRTIECLSNGKWDNPYPKCGEVTCEGEQLLNVDVLMGHPGIVSPYKPGHILVFRCTDVNLKMYGQRTIECLSNGRWDNPYPKCGGAMCPINTAVEDLIMERSPDIEGPVKPGHRLIFSCNREGLKLKGQREITCQSNGEWSSPFPECEEVMCVANLTVNMRSDVTEDRRTGPEVSVRSGHTITLSCVGKGVKLQGRSKITCLSNGQWEDPFPKCVGEPTCPLNTTVEDLKMERSPDNEGPVKPGHTIKFSCKREGLKLKGEREITCQSNGEWNSSFPECEAETTGEAVCPLNTTVEDLKMERSPDIEGPIKHKHTIRFSCKREGLKLKGEREITCLPNGKWSSSFPECEAETTDGQPDKK